MAARNGSSRSRRVEWAGLVLLVCAPAASAAELASLPANQWVLLDEVAGRGKCFAAAVCAEGVDRLYVWGFGGKMLSRSLYERFELESFPPGEGRWADALPAPRREAWAGGKWPPFRIHGYDGTDGPRIRSVGSMRAGRVSFWQTDGLERPSPVAIFNQACYDSKRGRVLFFAGGRTFVLDPRTNTWTDLKPSRSPTACGTLCWASLCYDPGRDRALLFGGGLGLNPDGGARTWLYDCAANTWRRPKLAVEPPLRCNAPIVYDAKAEAMVLFGGYDQTAALNDTWVYHCREARWQRREPKPSPPPMFTPAAAAVPGGGYVLACGANALNYRRGHGETATVKETWAYDVAGNAWRPLPGGLDLPRYDWLTAAGGGVRGVVFLVAYRPDSPGKDIRRTYALRYDPAAPAGKHKGAPPGTVHHKYPDQWDSLRAALPRSPAAAAEFFRTLPANTVVDANFPGLLISKTWSSATIDTDRGEVIYTGGGHSGYSGNDVAHYRVDENRWSLSWRPCFPPFLESTNSSVFGLSYGPRPWSQHTYRWYAYDPVSKRVIYCARPAGPYDGDEALLDDDPNQAFVYDRKKHGHLCWVYDPARRCYPRPSLGRPFDQSWCLALVSTPRGVFARPGVNDNNLYLATVRDDRVSWKVVDTACPKAKQGFSYEFQPLVYDGKRKRLLLLMGKGPQVEVYARRLDSPGWEQLKTTGPTENSREVVYSTAQDALVSLGEGKLHVLEHDTLVWRELAVKMPEGLYRTECAMVYDPQRDVCVMLIPSRFSGPMKVYLFRYDPKRGQAAFSGDSAQDPK